MRNKCEYGSMGARCGKPVSFRVYVGTCSGGWVLCEEHTPMLVEAETERLGDLTMKVYRNDGPFVPIAVIRKKGVVAP